MADTLRANGTGEPATLVEAHQLVRPAAATVGRGAVGVGGVPPP